jgi:LuxR family maltose regulon positive regulatory protein
VVLPISSVRLSVPNAILGELPRTELVRTALANPLKHVYIHGGAGYGKTTLLSQLARASGSTVWITFDGENDVLGFMEVLAEAIRKVVSDYSFRCSEYIPFEGDENFLSILANACVSGMEKYKTDFVIVFDDLHTLENKQIRALIARIIKFRPNNLRFLLGSREAPWQELAPFLLRGGIFEITQGELAFTGEETRQFLGCDDAYIYRITEGWPIAVGSFKVLLENGFSVGAVSARQHEALHSYLFCECVSRQSHEMLEFLKISACFTEMEPEMLDAVLERKNTRLVLESLCARNLFTIRTGDRNFRYHPLFREYLLEATDREQITTLQRGAADYYFETGQYSPAARYAILTGNRALLGKIILLTYRDEIRNGSFSELRTWFHALEDESDALSRELLIARGAFLSSMGNFTEANACLDAAIPLLKERNSDLYIEAMVHKARVLRNFISFEQSNQVLDELLAEPKDTDPERVYMVTIEKIYNLCWNSQVNEAYTLAYQMIETCASEGNLRVRAWYERYLSVIHYVAGRMKDSTRCYEKSLDIPESERRRLELHSVDIYVAKAYQMLGERERAIELVTSGLQRLRSVGQYEELWLGYLFAAEIHYQNTTIDQMNGGGQSYETTMKYFTLADEYAPLYRKSRFQQDWARLQRSTYALMFMPGEKEQLIEEIFKNIPLVGDHFKTVALGRLYNYFGSISDFERAVDCARRSIEIGEKSNTMMVATMAYGFLGRISLANRDYEKTAGLVRRFLQLCDANGIYEYFRMRKAYDPILQFAYDSGIEIDIVKRIMDFSGCRAKKAYIKMLGDFSVFACGDRRNVLKMRTRKERELLAFLLDAGYAGVTKEEIYLALWYDSESNDVKKLIGVNLAQIKKDLATLDAADPIRNLEKHYSICMEEIVTDIALFEEAVSEFRLHKSAGAAKRVISLYGGEYLSGFEAHWAARKCIEYHNAYSGAVKYIAEPDVYPKENLYNS